MIEIKKATLTDINLITPLFDAYRVFYKQQSNLDAANQFLKDRLTNKDSIIYIAFLNNEAVGFTQLYPLFYSVSMQAMMLLNDLYVESNHRNKGIGEALINKAKSYCKAHNLKGLGIQTAHDNPAQHLYQRLGFVRDTDLQFFWTTK